MKVLMLTHMMADEFNFLLQSQNYIAEADADLILAPGQLARCGVLLSPCFGAPKSTVADLMVGRN